MLGKGRPPTETPGHIWSPGELTTGPFKKTNGLDSEQTLFVGMIFMLLSICEFNFAHN